MLWRSIRTILFAGVLLAVGIPEAPAGPGPVLVVLSADNAEYRAIGESLERELSGVTLEVAALRESRALSGGVCAHGVAVIAVGFRAHRWSGRHCAGPRLTLLVTRAWLAEGGGRRQGTSMEAALYLECDPVETLRLIHRTLPGAARVGVVHSPHSAPQLARLREVADSLDMEILAQSAEAPIPAIRRFRFLSSRVDAFLVLADRNVLDGTNIKPVVMLSVRQGVPLFGGTTPAYVRAGIVAGLYPRAGENARVAARRFLAAVEQGGEGFAMYGDGLRLEVNHKVADHLGIRPPGP